MTSPALRRRQKVLARLAARPARSGKPPRQRPTAAGAPEGPQDGPAGTEYAALLAVLHENLRSLSDIASHEQRQPKKAEYARVFRNWIDGVLEADQPVQDDILLTNMIWALDYRDFDYALRLACFAIEHGLAMPSPFSRTPACFLAEEVALQALSMRETVPHDVLIAVAGMVEGHDMPDQVTAKLLKALGRSWKARAEDTDVTAESGAAGIERAFAEEAIACFQRALELFADVGVKKDIQQTESLLKKLTAEAAAS